MKKFIILLVFVFTINIFSQTTNQGTPKSWKLHIKNKVEPIVLPQLNFDKIIQEDTNNDSVKGKPYRVGIPLKVNKNLFNSGTWITLENGDRLWLLEVESKDALYLSFNLSDFYLPKKATLYFYNDDKSDVLGAYTNLNNNKSKKLGTWFVKGSKVWVEYYEPKEVAGKGNFTISEVIHVYRLKGEHQIKGNTRLNESGDCNLDVDCPVGADFDPTKDIVKHSIAFLSMGNGYICSGSLINNTANDKTPYFLTANHCYTDGNGNPSNPALYAMRFNWITSGTPVCASTQNSANGPQYQVMNGAVLRAKHQTADFMLVQLNNAIPQSWDIEFEGWDRSDTNPSFEVGIHHPSGDIMKVCRDNTGAIKTSTGGIPIWVIGGTSFGGGGGWELGVTEGGSSGSPLFNQDGRVIGQLWAGSAACQGTNDNNDIDYYGRFAASWNGGGTPSTRLSDWLDPLGTGSLTTDSLSVTASVDEVGLLHFDVYPNPTKGIINVKANGLDSNYTFKIIDVLGKTVKSGLLNSKIDISDLESNFYFLKITDVNTNKFFIKKIVLTK